MKALTNKNKLWTTLALAGALLLTAVTASADNTGVYNPNPTAAPADANQPNNGGGSGTTVSGGNSFQPIPGTNGPIYPPNIPMPYPSDTPPPGWNGKLQTTTGLDVNGWVAVGSVAAQILTSNQPVVNVNTPSLSILPVSQPNWTQLAGWSMPITKTISFVYHGTSITYNLTWNADGSLGGVGKYIANLRANIVKMSIGWGYTYDVVTEAHDAINRGTADNPIAAIGFDVKFRVHTYFKEEQVTQSFFITGDGQIAQLQ